MTDLLDGATTVPLSAPVNLRNLAGTPIDGGVIGPRFALRTDDLATITSDVADDLVADGLTAVIDLRSWDEVAATGRGPLANRPVTYHHIPLMASIAAPTGGGAFPAQAEFAEMYVAMVETAAAGIVQALGVIATTPGTAGFHCAAGQDRTGVLAASLLLALGAQPEQIVEDYAKTGENSAAIMLRLAPVMGPLLARAGLDLEALTEGSKQVEFSDAPIRGLLETLTARYGDPLTPLRRAGLTDSLIEQLRVRALQDA